MAEFTVTFETKANPAYGCGQLQPHEIYALLDWCFGELTGDQAAEYGRSAKYPDSLRKAAGAREAKP